ncbi:MAG: DUF1553 domain-containing protein [Planctomycetota bacterium]|nr:MAG: DUF1553 domain-containing protein [Planctomycetota bacterium]
MIGGLRMDFNHGHSRRKRHRHAESVNPEVDVHGNDEIRRPHRFSVANLLILLLTIGLSGGAVYWLYEYQQQNAANESANVLQEQFDAARGDEAEEPDLADAADSETPAGEQAPSVPENPYSSGLPPEAATAVDEIVFSRLAELEIAPAEVCSDGVFLRRAYITTLGTIPTVEEAKQFLDDTDADKRARLIDELLERAEFADYAAMKWCDTLRVKAEFPINLWPNAAQAYHHWIRTAIDQNMPYDQFARELLTSSGSNFRTPQVNFYRAVQGKEPVTLAQAVALTFLGQRTDAWPETQLDGMSAFFSQVGFKPTGEWKEEIVFFDRRKSLEAAGEGGPLQATFPGGETVTIPPGEDPRVVFADWLTRPENDAFSRAIANRVWYWVYGRGIVEEPDDMRPDNLPVHPELLDLLAQELVDSGYDLRHLYRLILNSETFQLSCLPKSDNPHAGRYFAYFPARRLEAEVLIDAICKITGTTEVYSSIIPEPFTFLPEDQRAVALPDGSITSSFLEMFGRPARDTGLASERNDQLTAAQALHLLNSNHIRQKIQEGPGLEEFRWDDRTESMYLAILSRRPTAEEYSRTMTMGKYGATKELAWALINSDEFLFQH